MWICVRFDDEPNHAEAELGVLLHVELGDAVVFAADDVLVVVLGTEVVGAGGGDGQLRAGHGDEDVVHVLHAVVLHDQLAVDRMLRLGPRVRDDHVSRRILRVFLPALPPSCRSPPPHASLRPSPHSARATCIFLREKNAKSAPIQLYFASAAASDSTSIPSSSDANSSTIWSRCR